MFIIFCGASALLPRLKSDSKTSRRLELGMDKLDVRLLPHFYMSD
jgi:hypothetical protein